MYVLFKLCFRMIRNEWLAKEYYDRRHQQLIVVSLVIESSKGQNRWKEEQTFREEREDWREGAEEGYSSACPCPCPGWRGSPWYCFFEGEKGGESSTFSKDPPPSLPSTKAYRRVWCRYPSLHVASPRVLLACSLSSKCNRGKWNYNHVPSRCMNYYYFIFSKLR